MLLEAIEHYTETLSNPPGTFGDLRDYIPVGGESLSGESITEDSARTISAFFGALRIVSSAVAGLPLELLRHEGDRRTQATDDPLYGLLKNAPNTFIDSYLWRSTGLSKLITQGAWYNYILESRGEILGFIPIEADRLTPEFTKTQRKRFRVSGGGGSDDPIAGLVGDTIPEDKILEVIAFTDDYLNGLSLLSFARQSLGLGAATERAASRFFRQGLLHRGFFTIPDQLGPDEEAEFQSSMQRQAGAHNAGSAPLLPHGITFAPASMSIEDAQLLESRAMTVRDVARFFNFPPDILGDTAAQPRANMEQNSLRMMTYGLLPWAITIEKAIQRQILMRFPRYRDQGNVTYSTKHKFQGFLRTDFASRSRAYVQYLQWGIMNRDEIRQREDMNPLEDERAGKAILQPLNHGESGQEPPKEPAPDF